MRRWSRPPGRSWRGRRGRAGWRSPGSSRWWRTSVAIVATSAAAKPIRGRRSRPRSARPTTLWSPGQPLPMSCSSAPTQQQVGPVDVAGQLGGGRGGLHQVPVEGEAVPRVVLRQRCAPGPTPAAAGRAGRTGPAAPAPGPARRPLASSRRNDQRTSAGHGSGSGGQCTASHSRVSGESSRSARAAAAAARSSSPGSAAGPGGPGQHHLVALADDALGERLAAHPPVAAARDGGPAPASTRRQVSSATKASRRPARLTSRSSASLVGQARARSATGRCSWRTQHVAAAGRCAGAARRGRRAATRRPPRRSARRLVGDLGGGDARAAPGPRAARRRPP